MKRLLSYISVALLCCLSASSCIFEKVEDTTADEAIVRLKLCMPVTRSADTRALGTETPDTEKPGSVYENTINGIGDVKIFIFDNGGKKPGKFLGEATNLKMIGGISAIERYVEGTLPSQASGKNVRLVFMANYSGRGTNIDRPTAKYENWRRDENKMIFRYAIDGDQSRPWSEQDAQKNRYIPMSGQVDFKVDPKRNEQSVVLTRAVAKVRVQVADESKSKVTNIRIANAKESGFCLGLNPGEVFNVPSVTIGQGLSELLVSSKELSAGQHLDFYIPEQDIDPQHIDLQTSIWIAFDHKDKEEKQIYFAYYGPDGNIDPSKGTEQGYYNIERNHLYTFIVNKKKDENKVDVQVSVMPWTTHDLNTDFE